MLDGGKNFHTVECAVWQCYCRRCFVFFYINVSLFKISSVTSLHEDVSSSMNWHYVVEINQINQMFFPLWHSMKIHFIYSERKFLFCTCMFIFIFSVRTEIKTCFYAHLPFKVTPNTIKMKFFISVSWRKVSQDLPIDAFFYIYIGQCFLKIMMNVSQVHPKRCKNKELNISYICNREILAGYLRHISVLRYTVIFTY